MGLRLFLPLAAILLQVVLSIAVLSMDDAEPPVVAALAR